MTMENLLRLMIHSNYDDNSYHRLVFLVTLTVFLKKFTLRSNFASIINALLSLSFIALVLILTYVRPCIMYKVDKRYHLVSTIVIFYKNYLYMFRASICPSSGVQVVCCCLWCSALGVVAVVTRSWCVVLCTVCRIVSECTPEDGHIDARNM
jgi:hypothetical protein